MTRINTAAETAAQTEAADRAEDRVVAIRSADGYDDSMPAFNRPECAALCRIWAIEHMTPRAIHYATMRGELASSKVVGRVKYSERDLRQWIQSLRRPVNTDGVSA